MIADAADLPTVHAYRVVQSEAMADRWDPSESRRLGAQARAIEAHLRATPRTGCTRATGEPTVGSLCVCARCEGERAVLLRCPCMACSVYRLPRATRRARAR